jgi:hypothetical protein
MVRQPWETRAGRRSRGGRCGPSLGRPPGGSFDHQPQHFLPLEFEVFREDRERGDVEGAPVIRGQSGVAPTGWFGSSGATTPTLCARRRSSSQSRWHLHDDGRHRSRSHLSIKGFGPLCVVRFMILALDREDDFYRSVTPDGERPSARSTGARRPGARARCRGCASTGGRTGVLRAGICGPGWAFAKHIAWSASSGHASRASFLLASPTCPPLSSPSLPLRLEVIDRGLGNTGLGRTRLLLSRHADLDQKRQPAGFVGTEPILGGTGHGRFSGVKGRSRIRH